jgi:hypothetical protein
MSSLGSAFSFAPARVFVLTGGQLSVYHWRRGVVDMPGTTYVADEGGLRGFATYLSDTPDLASYFLVDLVEEEFRHDTIPHVIGPDRKALLRTRVNRLFRDTQYRSAIVQGRESGGRRDDEVLFSALTRPELMAPWLAQIEQRKVPLVGIYSVPVVSQEIISKLTLESRNVLLVSLQSAGGLRQSYFRDGKLRVSRLSVAPRLEPAQQAPYILGEVEKVRRYLNSLRMLGPSSPLDVVVLTGRRLLNDLKRQGRDSMAVRFHMLDVKDVAHAHGCKTNLNTPYSDALFAHLLARSAPSNYYGTGADTRHMTHHRARAGMSAASVVILLGSIIYSGVQYLEGIITQRETHSLAEHAVFYEERYRNGKQSLPKVPAEPFALRQAVELAAELAKYKTDPLLAMSMISAGLAEFGRVRIDSIDWAASADPKAVIAPGGGVVPRSNDFRNPRPVQNLEPGKYYQLARLSGRIEPFAGDYRQALDLVNRFARALDRVEGVESVRVLRLPFDASSRNRLTGNARTVGAKQTATFEIRVVVPVNINGAESVAAEALASGTG